MKRLHLLSLCSLILCSATPESALSQNSAENTQPMLDFGQDHYTLSAWIKSTAPGPIFTVGELNGQWRSGSKCLYLGASGSINIRIAGAGHESGGPKLNDGQWHHIVLPSVYSWHFYIDGEKSFMYIMDGVPDPGDSRTPVPGGPGAVFKIGQGVDDYPNDTRRQFTGQIDDVRLYDRQLKEEEIKQLFEGRVEFKETSLIAHWPFEKSAADQSGNRHDLRSIGNITYADGHGGGSCAVFDGGIIFASSRCEYGTLCNSDDQLVTTVMYRIDADGKNMEKLSNSAVSEFTPSLMQDGQVLYTRWEYVDKGQIGVKCLWAMNPDGTASREVYGNNVRFPPTFIQGRQIPDEKNLFIVTGAPHWPHSGTGTLILVDTTRNIRSLEPMTYITPYIKVMQEPGYNQYDFDTKLWKRDCNGPLYRDPYPLSKELFIVSHNEDRTRDAKDASAYGLYMLDRKAQHTRIYRDPETSCWCAQPLRPRTRPPVVSMPRNPEIAKKGLAVCSVLDIYQGMENVKRGEVKWIRIMEQLPRPWSARRRWEPACGHTQMAGGFGPLSVKLLHGVVPVEEDGSAHFYVPADRNIYFQALNEDYLELQRERTYVNYRTGESRSCIGCHETPKDTPRTYRTTPIAMTKQPVMPQPQPGDATAARPLHYATDIQPIFDTKCISCHGEKYPAAGLRLTGDGNGQPL